MPNNTLVHEKIGFIGAGRVGTAFGQYMKEAGLGVSGYYSHNGASAEQASKVIDGQVYDSVPAIVADCAILFITTPDDAIANMAETIAEAVDSLEGKWIIHCSGSLESTVLDPCAVKGAMTASVHPLQAFGGNDDVHRLKQSYLTVETKSTEHRGVLDDLLTILGNPYKWILPEQKALYHGAAVVMSNYMVTLIEEGLRYLRSIGFEDEAALSMMMPLMEGTLKNVAEKGTVNGITGPIVRGDEGVVKKHLEAVMDTFGNEGADFYSMLARKTIEMLKGKRIDEATYSRLSKTIKKD